MIEEKNFFALFNHAIQCPKCQELALQIQQNRTFYCKKCNLSGTWEELWQIATGFSSIVLNTKEKTFSLSPQDPEFFKRAHRIGKKLNMVVEFPPPVDSRELLMYPQNLLLGWYAGWFVFSCLPEGSSIILPDNAMVTNNKKLCNQKFKSENILPQIYVPNRTAKIHKTCVHIVFDVIDAIALFKTGTAAAAIINETCPDPQYFLEEFGDKKFIILPLHRKEHRIAQELEKKLVAAGARAKIHNIKLTKKITRFHSVLNIPIYPVEEEKKALKKELIQQIKIE